MIKLIQKHKITFFVPMIELMLTRSLFQAVYHYCFTKSPGQDYSGYLGAVSWPLNQSQ